MAYYTRNDLDSDCHLGVKTMEVGTRQIDRAADPSMEEIRMFLGHLQDQSALEHTLLSRTPYVALLFLGIFFGSSSYVAYLGQMESIGLPGYMMAAVFIFVGIITVRGETNLSA